MPENKSKLVAKIVRAGPAFDGMEVQVGECHGVQLTLGHTTAFEVTAVRDSKGNLHPVNPGALWVNHQYLEVLPDSVVDAYGKFDFELRYQKSPLEIVLAQYENILTVSVIETFPASSIGAGGSIPIAASTNTLYTQNYTKNFSDVKSAIERELLTGDVDDLIFKLKEIKDSHG